MSRRERIIPSIPESCDRGDYWGGSAETSAERLAREERVATLLSLSLSSLSEEARTRPLEQIVADDNAYVHPDTLAQIASMGLFADTEVDATENQVA